jgi:hypothetical protein
VACGCRLAWIPDYEIRPLTLGDSAIEGTRIISTHLRQRFIANSHHVFLCRNFHAIKGANCHFYNEVEMKVKIVKSVPQISWKNTINIWIYYYNYSSAI